MFSIILVFFYLLLVGNGIRIKGIWDIRTKYMFLKKFGFQKTQIDELSTSRGYIYGNVTLFGSKDNQIPKNLGTMIVVDGDYILDIHANAKGPWWSFYTFNETTSFRDLESARCKKIFERINTLAWDKKCAPRAEMDFLRVIPCIKSQRCSEEDDPNRMIQNSQFTYTIQDLQQPRYWYLAFVACRRNEISCEWESTIKERNNSANRQEFLVHYNIWLVNGDPKFKEFNKFEHQFSFEDHDILEIFILFFIVYLILTAIVQFKLNSFSDPFSGLLKVHLWLCLAYTFIMMINLMITSINGLGTPLLMNFSMLLGRWSESIFVLLIIGLAEHMISNPYGVLYAMNIQISRAKNIPLAYDWKSLKYFGSLAFFLLFSETILFLWALNDQDPVVDILVWTTTGGCLLLALRFLIIIWFLSILKSRLATMNQRDEDSSQPTADYENLMISNDQPSSIMSGGVLHFAAGSLLWLLALPMIVFIANTSVSALWRQKTITSK